MKISWKKIILYSLILFLLPIYSFIKLSPSSASLIGTKWYFYEEYSSPGGAGSWYKVSDTDSKKYFELQKNGEVVGDFFSYDKYYLMKDSSNFELLDSTKKAVGAYHCTINKDTLVISVICKEGCGWMFVKRN